MEPTNADLDATYSDWEDRKLAEDIIAYNVKVQQTLSEKEWKCQHCNRSNKGGFLEDKVGLRGQKCPGPSFGLTILFPTVAAHYS
jgi:hypothetical protein